MTLEEKFKLLEADNAPGQKVRQSLGDLNSMMIGEKLEFKIIKDIEPRYGKKYWLYEMSL
jgi:hypothetical protein